MNNPWFISRNECPACRSSDYKVIYQNPYTENLIKDYLIDFYSPQGMVEFEYLEGALYVLCDCNVCGLIFQRDVPKEPLMLRLYEYWIDSGKVFNQGLQGDNLDYYSAYAQELMYIISHFGKVPSALNFFDFGMGWGKWALMAKAFGCNSYGTELSPERIEHAKSNGIKIVTWDEIPQHRFDFINTEQVFEHISEPLQTLSHLQKALKPEGILKISVPTANDIERRLKLMDWKAAKDSKNSLNPVAPLEHINYFRRSSLMKMASKLGMAEVFIPVSTQIRYTTDWGSVKKFAKNILLPICHNFLKNRNYIFLRNI